jgi:isopenicillin N synthase-like dioxygenase
VLAIFSKQLQGIFALALGLEENALDHLFKYPLMDITIQHYCQGKVKPGLGAHADFGRKIPFVSSKFLLFAH